MKHFSNLYAEVFFFFFFYKIKFSYLLSYSGSAFPFHLHTSILPKHAFCFFLSLTKPCHVCYTSWELSLCHSMIVVFSVVFCSFLSRFHVVLVRQCLSSLFVSKSPAFKIKSFTASSFHACLMRLCTSWMWERDCWQLENLRVWNEWYWDFHNLSQEVSP